MLTSAYEYLLEDWFPRQRCGTEHGIVSGNIPPAQQYLTFFFNDSADSYVLQLMGAAQMTTIIRFLQGARLDESQLALYKVEKSGKDWHVLVYGLYSDVPQARAAITALSLQAQAQNPWPKAMLRIHEAMLSQ